MIRLHAARPRVGMLIDPREPLPPSNPRALERFVRAFRTGGHDLRIFEASEDVDVSDLDAVFVRMTTSLRGLARRIAADVEANGKVAIDDRVSIDVCCDKRRMLRRLRDCAVPHPLTVIAHLAKLPRVVRAIGYPCVLKAIEGSSCRAICLAASDPELEHLLQGPFARENDLIAQAFVPTAFDWRIGVLDDQPLYACRYHMVPGHWQIIRWSQDLVTPEFGRVEGVPISDVPPDVLRVGLRAAHAIGSGLYGVDVKLGPSGPLVIEVNDNPTIDTGNEDAVDGDLLYERIVASFRRRIWAAEHSLRAVS